MKYKIKPFFRKNCLPLLIAVFVFNHAELKTPDFTLHKASVREKLTCLAFEYEYPVGWKSPNNCTQRQPEF